ncbi:T-cell activation Rho GTPase-activating protein isoform X1 [Tupaia chinensis]|uniref:T-cell activation Rho GTPase-activating protein isoform X1 n=2 Tax=Tupaia chinensis TaxID=246437 RepID=UPI0003C8E413|nr:T-cell activation Rho GTPase-activating protein isoform X1 [Tupaia chinensis]XP_027630477.1 T-cell activation Rho GTPase-activating protein isoform X1 [Tupaia chinensis]XP_027630478.1 T-cell activation Rho GTPase-activating protein isoform X1 [Tupaia chinensis]XP_027630479.1 T-cell activation Rho GTPase-activating protein isoform X1 [Tupaia chinensis]
MKLISSCNASKTLNDSTMETLIGCQSEGDIKDQPLLVSCESEDSLCQLIEVKKRKKVLPWPFLSRRLSPSSDLPGALEPELKASLFDQPLSILCGENDTLPRPIQDILTVLCLKGPSTEGIFRKAANEKARKELKEELSSGGEVDLDGLPVHLLAVVFKDFLRSIPQKLLSCDLFEEWMGALEEQDEEDRIEALKQVADKLPRPNLLLLKHLVYVLYLISKNSEINKMDSSNLAICIGPNVLCPENDQSLSFEAQKDLNSKVKTLVEFLIDNCFEIFGENIPVHSSVASDDSLVHTDSSDVSTLQNDSAYDSTDPDSEFHGAITSPCGQPPLPSKAAGLDHQDQLDTCDFLREPTTSALSRLKSSLSQPDRRYSEPSMLSSQVCLESRVASQKLTKSEDDFTMARAGARLESEEAEDPFPEEVFPEGQGKSKRPGDLKIRHVTQGLLLPRGLVPKAFSSSSLDGSSESSPIDSPSSPKRNIFTRHQSFTTKADKGKPSRDIKKHSMSFSFTSHKRVLAKTPSFGSGKSKGSPRDHSKKGFKRETQLAGRIIQENGSEIHGPAGLGLGSGLGSCTLRTDDVFQKANHRGPSSPPSYEEAIQHQAFELAAYGSQTVGSVRARMCSGDTMVPPLPPPHQGEDSRNPRSRELLLGHGLSPQAEHGEQSRAGHASMEALWHVTVPGRPELPRQRTMSEAMQKSKWDSLTRRRSQPVFDADQLRYAKESYI